MLDELPSAKATVPKRLRSNAWVHPFKLRQQIAARLHCRRCNRCANTGNTCSQLLASARLAGAIARRNEKWALARNLHRRCFAELAAFNQRTMRRSLPMDANVASLQNTAITAINGMLRGEIAAVESYNQAIYHTTSDLLRSQLDHIRDQPQSAVFALPRWVRESKES